jgi:hypothetical protein
VIRLVEIAATHGVNPKSPRTIAYGVHWTTAAPMLTIGALLIV